MKEKEPIFDQTIQDQRIVKNEWKGIDLEGCTLRNLNLSDADLSGSRFIDSEFIECDLSNIKFLDTSFQNIIFRNCKLLGVPFEKTNRMGFSVDFHHSLLDHSTFYQMDLRNCSFQNCRMTSVDLAEANLSGTTITDCDLLDVNFDQTHLEKADLVGSTHFHLDPENNFIKGARVSQSSLPGLLDRYELRID